MIDKIDEIEYEVIRAREIIKQDKIDKLNSLKSEALSNYDVDCANYIWLFLTAISIKNSFIKAYSFVKNNEYKNAWDTYEKIESMLMAVRRNFPDNFGKMQLDFIEEKTRSFQKLFPYQYFMSRESIKKVEYCSICQKKIVSPRNACMHIPGKVYFGEIANRIVTDLEIVAIALVKNPADKFAVIFPNELEYNYDGLSTLISILQSPYDDWNLKITKKKNSIYNGVGRNDICPCGSYKKYKRCCQGTDKELIDSYQITISENPRGIKPFTMDLPTWK
ncbi:SEC-C domain-containing protein [Enterococcus sp. BWT-B8]|uniref:YecA family protein n=1 Tax=Enterococcus sp. BWT-B8 TaxID=2885157 RepID=UPI001E5ACA3E|nr:SEC-C metal-binding domain-containing protein [Enterococcus sp. BWT-B8]MCB5953252.1 SEC-C domain-containing protein [Enterococcus sp. BWT-B8]